MSKLEQLIERMCPDGLRKSELSEFIVQSNERNKKRIYTKVRSVTSKGKLLDPLDLFKNEIASEDTSNYKVVKQGVFAYNPARINIGSIACSDETEPVIVSPMYVVFKIDNNRLLNKYFEYFLNSPNCKKQILGKVENGARFRFPYEALKTISIQVPTLEVQQEIVRILDTFTMLEAELEAELEARKKQYITYLDELLKLKKDTPQVAIKDVVDITRGVRVTKNQIANGGSFSVYQNSLVPMGYFDKFNFNENSTYIISAGAAGEVGFSKSKFWAADDCFVLRSEKGVINKFVYYCLKSKQNILFSNVRRASIPRLSRNAVEDIKIPFFDIETQQRIVTILDHFDTLVNDLSQGLPAEIVARRKQYEYYRNKLLTFKEVKHESV